MKIESTSIFLVNTRTVWNIKPMTKVFKSKKTYNRKNKSWKKEE